MVSRVAPASVVSLGHPLYGEAVWHRQDACVWSGYEDVSPVR